MDNEIKKRFLTNTDETGRFVVKSFTTGISYYVEPIGDGHFEKWGDVDPSTKKMTGSYGEKYAGSIRKEESLITEDNGFVNISEVKGSPLSEIYERDKEYERQMKTGRYFLN